MTLVSNDSTWWPFINANLISSYFIGLWRVSSTMAMTGLRCHFAVAGAVGIVYDWGRTFEQEVELIWVSPGLPHQKHGMKIQLVHGRGNAHDLSLSQRIHQPVSLSTVQHDVSLDTSKCDSSKWILSAS
ncbi:hypothetical protein BDR07DRAFT_1466047 [Suillus spraguei]|nr:hypothetical protein BDR07DRAFT_1466047 [Suillus spraguei]